MITRLIYKGQNAFQLIVASIGTIIGLFIIIGTIQFYIEYKQFVSGGKDLVTPNTIVIQKKVSPLNTISLVSTDFSEKEIESLRKESFIDQVDEFESNHYRIYATIGKQEGGFELGLDLFFEAVDDKYLDANPLEWKWNESSEFVPIILSKDYLRQYNSSFSKSQGLPVFSEEAFSLVTMKINTYGNGRKGVYKGKIVGFTEKVNSLLVPLDFLTHTNAIYGSKEKRKPTRLILTTAPNAHGHLIDLLKRKGLDAGEDKLEISQQKSQIHVILQALIAIGTLIIILSILGFIQYAQIMINKVKYELEILLNIGHDHINISKKYLYLFLLLLGFVTIITILIAFMAKLLIFNPWIEKQGFKTTIGLHWYTWSATFIFLACFFFVNWLVIVNNIKRLATGRQ